MMKPAFSISPANHIYCDLSQEVQTLEMDGADPHALNIKELVITFKKKSFLKMPGKHPGLVNAHARFEELNSHFLALLDHSLQLRDLKRADVLPGKVNTKKFEFLIPLEEGSTKLWKMAITKTYKDIVTEPREKCNITERRFSVIERRHSIVETLGNTKEWKDILARLKDVCDDGSKNNPMKKRVSIVGKTNYKFVQVEYLSVHSRHLKCSLENAIGRGASYVIYWRCRKDYGNDPFKINLTVYDKDVLQVWYVVTMVGIWSPCL